MKIYSVLLSFCLLGLVQSFSLRLERSESQSSEAIQAVSLQGITKEKAIAIAKKHALRRYKSLKRFRVVACELTIFWRVIFDGGGPEYVIDKESGAVRRVQIIPQNWTRKPDNGYSEDKSAINREEAIEIAKRDAESVPGIDIERFTVTACELQKVWRVFVEHTLHIEPAGGRPVIPHSSAPNYVIDKKTGTILSKQRYGSAKH